MVYLKDILNVQVQKLLLMIVVLNILIYVKIQMPQQMLVLQILILRVVKKFVTIIPPVVQQQKIIMVHVVLILMVLDVMVLMFQTAEQTLAQLVV
ncbi:hypothetical protein C1645_769322 [Glomus cerebriforme]|uniref:Uncharacterized protein n=1 Tax=Glomus cerebriforme TaxID=658196 RepID=A0A397T083_9GLOM|nr:hypothetical protein C1645_769322 [Glomus cerebriforme]